MAQTVRMVRTIALTALLVTASCAARDDHSNRELAQLPSAAFGAVSIGPSLLKGVTDRDRTTVFVFDDNGSLLGTVTGTAIYANRILAAKSRIVTASSRKLATLTAESRVETPIDYEDIIETAVNDPASGAATMWFNSGANNGRYLNKYAMVRADGSSGTGSVAGHVRAATYCGERSFALVQESLIGTTGEATKNWLYELDGQGEPVVRGQWEHSQEIFPASRMSVCAADGQTIFSLYSSPETRADASNGPALSLVRNNVIDGSRTETPLVMAGHNEEVRRSSLALADGKILWLNGDGDILSVPTDGSAAVTREWGIPGWGDKTMASVVDGAVSVIDFHSRPTFSRYDLRTGTRTKDPVELPWLEPTIGADTESRKNIYSVSDIAAIPR
ncbi:hypothetical protein [Nocardia suismassiliense]|uniref:hypothetical protein n=1 Tax=Nocardia suismassiliense TaxID=2077092 RepID=UPI00131ED773|nr:hypothetical protein [Nocardia suismassiliense]